MKRIWEPEEIPMGRRGTGRKGLVMSKYDALSNNVQELVMALAHTDAELSNRIDKMRNCLKRYKAVRKS